MPTTEPIYGWPLPLDTDPLSAGAKAIRDLAGGVSGTLNTPIVRCSVTSTWTIPANTWEEITTSTVEHQSGQAGWLTPAGGGVRVDRAAVCLVTVWASLSVASNIILAYSPGHTGAANWVWGGTTSLVSGGLVVPLAAGVTVHVAVFPQGANAAMTGARVGVTVLKPT